jgi:hypothetical protein
MSSTIDPITTSPKLYLAIGVVLTLYIASRLLATLKYRIAISKYPLVNPKWGPAEKAEFTTAAAAILAKGVEMAKGKPFRMNDKSTPRLIIPPKYIDEIKNDNRLDFHNFVSKQFFGNYPGFDAFSESVDQTIFQDAVRTQLTRALGIFSSQVTWK